MAAAMNGLALHGGIVPYGATFLVFTDYCRPSIRLSALMGQRVVYVMTHDSIGLGEDGPTHQPVEQLAALRAMPNLNVFRPADAVEVAECWEVALLASGTPSILALTRQGLPALRTKADGENLSAKGAYVLAEAGGGKRDVTILATGSEVSLAMEAREQLEQERRSRRSGVDAVLGAVRGPAGQLSQGGAGLGAAHRRRGGDRHGLGALARRWRHVHRHERLRGLGAGAQAVRALRHHRRPYRGGGKETGELA